jgi:hypothetical protein
MKPKAAAVVQNAIRLLNNAASPASGNEPLRCHSRRTSMTAQSNRPQGPRHCQRGHRPQGAGQDLSMGPTFTGGRDWPSGGYNPKTNAMFIPLQNLCFDTVLCGPIAIRRRNSSPTSARWAPGKELPMRFRPRPARRCGATRVTNFSPVLGTAAGLVFNGDRCLRAYDDADGKVLRQTRLASQALGFTLTHVVNGRHYVAIAAGRGSTPAVLRVLLMLTRPPAAMPSTCSR